MGKLKNRKMEEWNGKWANDMKKNLMVGSSFIYILHFSFHSSLSQFLHSNILPFFMFSSSWGVGIHIRLSSRLRSTNSFSRGLHPERSQRFVYTAGSRLGFARRTVDERSRGLHSERSRGLHSERSRGLHSERSRGAVLNILHFSLKLEFWLRVC